MTKTAIKKELRQLINKLPESELNTARRFLQYLASLKEDLVLKALESAPWDDKPLTKTDIKALNKAHKSIAEGHILSDEEFRRRVSES